MVSAVKLNRTSWPIACAMLPFHLGADDSAAHGPAGSSLWRAAFDEVAMAGFDTIDLTDTWIRVADLGERELDEFGGLARQSGLAPLAVSVIRRSVIDAQHGDENLAYSHRAIVAAAHLGAAVVSVGLHQPLTAQQRGRLWFWTAMGHRDDPQDLEARARAVQRLRELGTHAADLGLLLSLELYEDTYLGTATSAVRLVEEIGLDNVGLNPDTANLLRLHRPVDDWREALALTLPYANFWHVKNYQRDEDPDRGVYLSVPSTMEVGVINYREAIRIAINEGFQGVISCEHYGGDGLSVSASNARYLRGILPARDDYALGSSRVRQSHGEKPARGEAR